MRTLLVSLTLLVVTVHIQARAEDPEPPGDLHVAINKGIRLLEKKEYQKFLETFVTPDDLKKFVTKERALPQFAEEFGRGNAPTLLTMLKGIKNTKPTWAEGGKLATFSLKEQVKGLSNDRIRFTKVKNRWYILNN